MTIPPICDIPIPNPHSQTIGLRGSPPGRNANPKKEIPPRREVIERIRGLERLDERCPTRGDSRREVTWIIPVRVEERMKACRQDLLEAEKELKGDSHRPDERKKEEMRRGINAETTNDCARVF